MDAIGRVEQIPKAGNTLAKLVRSIEERKIIPTHFLILQFTYHANLEKKFKQSIPTTFFENLNGKPYRVQFSEVPGDSGEITWSSENIYQSSIFWTTSRLEETYVKQMTRGLLRKVFNEVHEKLHLNPGNFQLSMLINKNLSHVIDIEIREEAAVVRLAPNTPRPDQIEEVPQ